MEEQEPYRANPFANERPEEQGFDFDLGLLIQILLKSWYWFILILALFVGGA